jgi:pimeloyl-ACP methyl ester carboxylesterase
VANLALRTVLAMFLDLSGVRVYFEAAGSGRPVVLLHGWGARAAAMRPIFEALEADHAVYALDFPGFGQSARPPAPWGVGDYCRVVVELLDREAVGPASFVGHSFGGRVGIKLATERPELVDKLVLVDAAGIRHSPGVGRALLAPALRGGKALLGALPALGLRERAENLARARLGSDDYRMAGPLRETFVRVVGEDLRPLLPRIQAPTLLVWGDRDEDTPLADARVMEKEIPDAGLVVLKGAGHFSYLDRPADFARIVRTFLAQP